MLAKATLAAIPLFCSAAIADELRSYKVTVMEQIRRQSQSWRPSPMRREATRSWRRAEPRDPANPGGSLRRQAYRRIRGKPTALP